MSPSSLSGAIKRTGEVLKTEASSQISDYENRFSSLKNLYDQLLSNLIVMKFDCEDAYETAKEFFDSSSVRFAGVDGTMYSRPLFDMVVFFGGAYASTGTITFQEKSSPQVEYDMKTLQHAAGISSVVPVYINEIPEIDRTAFETESQIEAGLGTRLADQSIISNATIANWIMTFSEYFLAYKLAINPMQDLRIILLDRSLSVDHASLIYDTSKRELWKSESSLIGYSLDHDEPFDINDFTIARQCICNSALGLPPPRADFLSHSIFQLLKQKGALTEKQILTHLDATKEKRAKRVRRHLKRALNEAVLEEKNDNFSLNPKYIDTSERIQKLVEHFGDQFFFSEKKDKNFNVMKISKGGRDRWLTTVDIAFLTLFTLHMLMEECWKRRILLVGVTKDTAARDFKRQLIPVMQCESMLDTSISNEDFEKLPNTDRLILQSASLSEPEKIKPPWGLIEYDSAFRTIVSDSQHRRGYVSGAIRNRISIERTFLKTYVQLSQAKTDPNLRSNVLLIDRLVHPTYDYKSASVATLWNEFGGAEEPLEVILFKDKNVPNKLQNLLMIALVSMAPSSIPEAFGHNKPLFIADKIAKWNYSQFRCIVDTTAGWMLNDHKLRRFLVYMSTFRERRATIETARREQA